MEKGFYCTHDYSMGNPTYLGPESLSSVLGVQTEVLLYVVVLVLNGRYETTFVHPPDPYPIRGPKTIPICTTK